MRIPIAVPALCLIFLGSSALQGETRVLSTRSGGKTTVSQTERRESPGPEGLKVEETSEEERVETLLAQDGTARSVEVWAKDGGHALLVRDGSGVDISGVWKGKPVSARCDLKGEPFYGRGLGFAAAAFAAGGFRNLEFAYIRIDKPSKPMIMQLLAEGQGDFKGAKAVKAKFCPAGALSAFWSSRLLLDEKGNILRYEGNMGPGSSDFVTELVEVKP